MYTNLFKNVSEINNVSCETYGTIANWLQGNLYRNGPGLFDFEKQSVSHWFDAMGLLHHFKIKNCLIKIAYVI